MNTRRYAVFRLTVYSLLALLAAACAPKAVQPPALVLPVPPGLEEELLTQLEQNALAFSSLEGVAKVKVTTDDRALAASQVIWAEKPDHLRAETLNPFGFGQPVLLMATDGVELSVLVPGEGQFYRGIASSQNLQRFTRMPLRVADLVHLLLYQVPVIAHRERSIFAGEEGGYRLVLEGEDGGREELSFDRQLRLIGASFYGGDELLLRVVYDRFIGETNPFPTLLRLKMPDRGVDALLDFADIRTNVAIPPERFALTPPVGIEVRPIP